MPAFSSQVDPAAQGFGHGWVAQVGPVKGATQVHVFGAVQVPPLSHLFTHTGEEQVDPDHPGEQVHFPVVSSQVP